MPATPRYHVGRPGAARAASLDALRDRDNVRGRNPELLHHLRAGRRKPETFDPDARAVEPDVRGPGGGDRRLDRHAPPAGPWQHLLAVLRGLTVETCEARHADDAR